MSAQPSEATRPAELDDDAIWAWWCRESAEQGLAPELHPLQVRRVAEVALAGSDDGATQQHQDRRAALAGSARRESPGQAPGARLALSEGRGARP